MAQKQKVLVVDDERSARRCLQALLTVEGYDVEAVSNGKDAISKIENGDRPDFILLDYLMPEPSGLQTLQKLMCLDRSLNVIMSSCSEDFRTIAEAIRLGARDFLIIPYERAELNATMLRVRQRQQNPPLGRCWVERQISPLSFTEQIEFWAASNL
jgi:DNA-binding NtrC family response regulator